ncbi:fluoride efflux transporter CrcB [Bacillus alkalicellulosilyticus]|uniref:fluoride efflux transporter CrcB n=1 Tax=Alkalihalobacterium alkalicellulosilyticum TaxID=1912214 RepID=UPI00099629CF|nr:fluoride efflux transporter CrcB [Bacillus alkalicellulosilyticus]
MSILLITVGGALGAISRYLLGLGIMRKFPHPPIPIAMLTVNLLGAFGLGIFFGVTIGRVQLGAYEDPLFLFFGIGFFGAFTTFSTFSMEAVDLLRKKLFQKAIVYICLSLVGSIFALLLGMFIATL